MVYHNYLKPSRISWHKIPKMITCRRQIISQIIFFIYLSPFQLTESGFVVLILSVGALTAENSDSIKEIVEELTNQEAISEVKDFQESKDIVSKNPSPSEPNSVESYSGSSKSSETQQESNSKRITSELKKNNEKFPFTGTIVYYEGNKPVSKTAYVAGTKVKESGFELDNSENPDFLGFIYECGRIRSPGEYILLQDIKSEGTCLEILSGNVKIDCNNYEIQYDKETAGTGIAVLNKNEIEIENCAIKQAKPFQNSPAIALLNSENSIIKSNAINTRGKNSQGIKLTSSREILIENNNIKSGQSNALFLLDSSFITALSNIVELTRELESEDIKDLSLPRSDVSSDKNSIFLKGTSTENIFKYNKILKSNENAFYFDLDANTKTELIGNEMKNIKHNEIRFC